MSNQNNDNTPPPPTTMGNRLNTCLKQNNDNTPPPPSTQNIHVKPNTEGHTEMVNAAGIVHGGVGNTYNEVQTQGEKERLEISLRDLRGQLSVKEREKRERRVDVQNLELKIEKLREEVETFRDQTHDKREDIQNIEKKICKLMEDIEGKKDEIAKLEKNIIPGLKKQIEKAEIRLEVLKETVEDTTNAIPTLEKKVRDLIQNLTKYGTDVKAEKESIAALYGLVLQLQNDLSDRKKDQKALAEKMQNIEVEQAKQKRQLEDERRATKELQRQMQKIEDERAEQKRQLNVEQAKQKRQLEDERRANVELQRQVQQLQDALQEKTTQNKNRSEQEQKASGDLKTRACQHAGGEAEQHGASSDVTETPATTETQHRRSAHTARVTHTDSDTNALHFACSVGDVDRVRRLLDLGQVDVNSRVVGGGSLTPVMAAAGRGHGDLVKLLVRRGADLSLVDECGHNALHHACMGEGDLETVEFLLSVMNEVDINTRNNDGETPADMAGVRGHHQLLDLLVSRGAV